MPLSLMSRLRGECRREFLRAASSRFTDGDVLWQAGRRGAAIYLWGYAVEMWLKSAYFRHLGFGESQPIVLSQMRQTLAFLEAQMPGAFVAPKNLHDLASWAQALVLQRQLLGRPYPAAFASQLLICGARIGGGWSESLRYHDNQASPGEAQEFRTEVSWIRSRTRIL